MKKGRSNGASPANSVNSLEPGFEAAYQEGATPLFLAIEEGKWAEAKHLIPVYPDAIKTWIVSTNKPDLWRRLPIHQACRSKPPAWLVSTLLSSFPESAFMKTQFDQLPLHLAVEYGAAPDVINLILVANFEAIVAKDKSGRIPLDILGSKETIKTIEDRAVHESLTRCYDSYKNVLNAARNKESQMQKELMAASRKLVQNHKDEITMGEETRAALEKEIEELHSILNEMKGIDFAKDRKIKKLQKDKEKYRDSIGNLQIVIQELEENRAKDDSQLPLDKQIMIRDQKIEELSNDLRNIALMSDGDIMQQVMAAEQSMRVMVSTQIALKKQLSGQAKGIMALLDARQIPLSGPQYSGEEEKRPESPLSGPANAETESVASEELSDVLQDQTPRQKLISRYG